MKSSLESYFKTGLIKLGLPDIPWAPFQIYLQELLKWNQAINLTAITTPEDIVERHFLDSLIPINFFSLRDKLLDIGTGGGFPGLPIKIALPHIDLYLADSVQKKINFLKTLARKLDLTQVIATHQTITKKPIDQTFEWIISRAALKISDLLTIALPHLTPNGTLIAMKGENIEQEIKDAEPILKNSGLPLPEKIDYELPFSKTKRTLFIFKNCST